MPATRSSGPSSRGSGHPTPPPGTAARLFRDLVETLPVAVLRSDAEGLITYANPAMLRLLGDAAKGIIHSPLQRLYPPALAAELGRDDRLVLDQGRVSTRIANLPLPGLGERQVWICKTPLRGHRKRGLQAVYIDLSEHMRAVQDFQLASAALKSAPQAVLITDPEGHILRVNPAFEAITGLDAQAVLGHNLSVLSTHQRAGEFMAHIWRALRSRGHWSGEISNRRPDGSSYTLQVSMSGVRSADGLPSHYVAMFHDITETRAARRHYEHLAQHDALTGLPNRLLLTDRLRQALAQATRHGQSVAVLFIDLDHFKQANDSFGHQAGDELLKQAAQRISSALRGSDTVTRQGGDEFIALLPDLKHPNEARPACLALLRALGEPFVVDEHVVHLSASIGVATFPADAADIENLLRCADMAMYEAKAAGRNRVHFYGAELEARARQQAELEAELRHALAQGELFIQLQPVFSLNDESVAGLEALVRWQHPQRGVLQPAEFLPFAEETRLLSAVGEQALRAACSARARLAPLLDPELPIAINLWPQQLADPEFGQRLDALLKTYGLRPAQIEFDISERALALDYDTISHQLAALTLRGLRLNVDDFGTGYSNLAALQRLPLHCLKLDASVVAELDSHQGSRAIARAACALADSLGLQLVAEGVETEQQRAQVAQLGCSKAQGRLLARPMRVDTLRRWLRKRDADKPPRKRDTQSAPAGREPSGR
jgi:diguanylate cyclase (GGDEF)-like protein/PAS domain S-box-containing protein